MDPMKSRPPSRFSMTGLLLPALFAVPLFALSFTTRVSVSPMLVFSFRYASVLIAACAIALTIRARQTGRAQEFEYHVARSHYVQALVQLAVYAYWGRYWSFIYDQAQIVLAQVLFAYGVDLLVHWARAERWRFGFGPLPDHPEHQSVPVLQGSPAP